MTYGKGFSRLLSFFYLARPVLISQVPLQSELLMKKLQSLILVLAGLIVFTAGESYAQSAGDGGLTLQVGDRIALRIEGPLTIDDTVIVREGVVIQIPNIGDVSMQGVKRSDVQTHLSREIARYVKEPVVYAVPLVRVSLAGAIARPGFYSVPSDMVLSDILMLAGGPLPNGDVNRSVVMRGNKEVMDKNEVAQALAAGLTLDEFHLTPGDQIVIGERSRGKMDNLLRVGGVVVGIAGVIVALSR